MTGGVSAQLTGLELLLPDGQTQKLVVRCHGEADRRRNPVIAADEFRLLQTLQTAGFPAPTPYALDLSCTILPIPYMVIQHMEGETDFAPRNLPGVLAQMAANLAQLHRITSADFALAFLPQQTTRYKDRPLALDLSLGEGRIRDALEAARPLPQRNRPMLLHGDYWPGNILWRDGKLVGVIDWEDACVGDPLSDVGNCRLEILWAYGAEAVEVFTRCYRGNTTADFADMPYWDLRAALRPCGKLSAWGLEAAQEDAMRMQHGWFVAQAIHAMA